ncbi:hypothetical protein J3A83DRAFT_4369554 [Scleroderma citrinum]
MQTNVAHHLEAFKKAVGTLGGYYQNLPGDPVMDSLQLKLVQCGKSWYWTNTSFSRIPFEDNLIFFAALSNQQLVCIKFARRYSKDAHGICASRGHAPTLRGFEKIPGGWFMIVTTPGTPPMISEKMPSTPRTNKVMFTETFVTPIWSDKTKFMLIDFEWAGKNGEVRDPMNVNKGPNLWRPDGAVDGALIMPGHDIDMLNHITTQDDLHTTVD